MDKVKTFREFLDEGKTFEGLSCEMQIVNIQQMVLALKEVTKTVYAGCCDASLDKVISIMDKVKKACCKQEKLNGQATAETHEESETQEHEEGESPEFEAGEQEERREIEGAAGEENEEEEEEEEGGEKRPLGQL